jgi:hypothetical protein
MGQALTRRPDGGAWVSSPGQYEIQAVATCQLGLRFIESKDACEAAAVMLQGTKYLTTDGGSRTLSDTDVDLPHHFNQMGTLMPRIDGCFINVNNALIFNDSGDRASDLASQYSICQGAVAVASTKGATNPGYCDDLDGRGESFVASSCYLPSSRVLKPSFSSQPQPPQWEVREACTGATCSPADCCVAASGVFINEILPTPSSAADPEWVEIFNAGATEGSLAGWTIEHGAGSVVWTGAVGSTIGVGGYFVAEAAVGAGALGDGGGTLVLRTSDGVEMDRTAYTSGAAADQVSAMLGYPSYASATDMHCALWMGG